MEKIALITGANRGLGKAIARQFAEQDITVVIGSRKLANGEAAAALLREEGFSATSVQLDVTDQRSIDAAVSYITEKYGKLDILVNNAGIAVSDEADKVSFDAFRKVYDVNVFGIVRVIEALLPLLKLTPGARIINISSNTGSFKTALDVTDEFYELHLPAYNSSKSTVNAITVQLSKILPAFGIAINAVNPGFIDTDLNGHTGTRPPKEAAEAVTWLALTPDSPNGRFYFDEDEIAW